MTAKLILSLEGADSGVGKFLFFKFLFKAKPYFFKYAHPFLGLINERNLSTLSSKSVT
jgi:hypothetical protein